MFFFPRSRDLGSLEDGLSAMVEHPQFLPHSLLFFDESRFEIRTTNMKAVSRTRATAAGVCHDDAKSKFIGSESQEFAQLEHGQGSNIRESAHNSELRGGPLPGT